MVAEAGVEPRRFLKEGDATRACAVLNSDGGGRAEGAVVALQSGILKNDCVIFEEVGLKGAEREGHFVEAPICPLKNVTRIVIPGPERFFVGY